ncbi:MAG: GNAT family N-acetyltransferase [Chitinophagaceae bacterium]|nr:GNAT family N-acetyltransferase [Chitinophagaceae bacterium]
MTERLQSERLYYRKFTSTDAPLLFSLDSIAEVHRYLGNNPLTHLEQAEPVILSLLEQYQTHNIARWATFEKESDAFIGWSGLKFITEEENNRNHFYDVGYRFIPSFWGKGYATEAALFALDYGFSHFNMDHIVGTVNQENAASKRVLEKCGLSFIETFFWRNIPCDWLEINRKDWEK